MRPAASSEHTVARAARSRTGVALIALFAGALAIGSAGIFVRLSETGPLATAFWRGALALPFLAVWSWLEQRRTGRSSWNSSFFWGGVLFAGDLAVWHYSLLLTSIAASTLEANLSPVVVTLIMWVFWRERPKPVFVIALMLALAGVSMIVSPKLGQGSGALIGDALGVATAFFYAGYLVVVSRLRSTTGTGVVMFRTTLVFTVLILPLALMQKFLPDTMHGWMLLVGLAVIAQFMGQGLIAYALAHLPATFGAVGLYVQPIASAVYAWAILGEQLTLIQIVGGVVTLGAIGLARSAMAVERASIQSSTERHNVSR